MRNLVMADSIMANSGAVVGDPPCDVLALSALQAAAIVSDPFEHIILPNFILPQARADIARDFPAIDRPGSIPPASLKYGPAFAALLRALQGKTLRELVAEKFNLDLTERQTLLTVRGQCRARDGQIHTDSRSKLITALLYMNEGWQQAGGRLRLLHGPDNIEDYAVEVPPDAWTLLLFRCTESAWHGHTAYEGVRRTIQLNWVRNARTVWSEHWRHRISLQMKRFFTPTS